MNKRMKIPVADDGSTCADNALDDLPRAGLPLEANVKSSAGRKKGKFRCAAAHENGGGENLSPQ